MDAAEAATKAGGDVDSEEDESFSHGSARAAFARKSASHVQQEFLSGTLRSFMDQRGRRRDVKGKVESAALESTREEAEDSAERGEASIADEWGLQRYPREGVAASMNPMESQGREGGSKLVGVVSDGPIEVAAHFSDSRDVDSSSEEDDELARAEDFARGENASLEKPKHPHEMAERGYRVPSPHDETDEAEKARGRAVNADGLIAAFIEEDDGQSTTTETSRAWELKSVTSETPATERPPASRRKSGTSGSVALIKQPRVLNAASLRDQLRASKAKAAAQQKAKEGPSKQEGPPRSTTERKGGRLRYASESTGSLAPISAKGSLEEPRPPPPPSARQGERVVKTSALRDRLRAHHAKHGKK